MRSVRRGQPREASAVERALEVVVYAPLGVALYARDALPGIAGMFVARGRSEIDQRRKLVTQQVTQAKTIGRFAVRFGGPEVRRRVEDGVASARTTAETTFATLGSGRGSGAESRPEPTPKVAASSRPAPAAKRATEAAPTTNGRQPAPEAAPPASALAIPDYDELSASQVVGRLEGLVDTDLETIRAYESAHRDRRTILGKIAQLRQ